MTYLISVFLFTQNLKRSRSVDWNRYRTYDPMWQTQSLPLRKCGLKLFQPSRMHLNTPVTSLAEVWIETRSHPEAFRTLRSLPLRKCGLKHRAPAARSYPTSHFPCGSVDWNRCVHSISQIADGSLPLRKCGLKPIFQWLCFWILRHFPCGSVDWNTLSTIDLNGIFAVTSLAEVWIETSYTVAYFTTHLRHFPCGSVDWNYQFEPITFDESRHFPCGSVDWNIPPIKFWNCLYVTSLAEVWIETSPKSGNSSSSPSLPLRKCGLKLLTWFYYTI